MKKTVLLTGGAGFISSHTAVELIDAGYNVAVTDDLSNSNISTINNIGKITGKTPKFYKIDVANHLDLDRVFSENQITVVIHFAGYKAVGESVMEPVKYYRNNLDTTLTLLEIMKKHRVDRFVFSSSATVYGDPIDIPITEGASVGKCINPYGRTKYFIEQMLTDVANANPDMSVVLLRYFNPIGAHDSGFIGEKPNGIPNNLLPYISQTAARIREKLNIFGNDYPTRDGTGVRDYIHVVDLAKGHVAALKYAEKHMGTKCSTSAQEQATGYLRLSVLSKK